LPVIRNNVSNFVIQVTSYKPRLLMLCRKFTMTRTKSSGTGSVLGTPQQKQFFRIQGRAGSAGHSLHPTFMEEADREMLNRFGEKFRSAGLDFGPEDAYEIKIMEQFLGRHVQKNRICEVQCMLLWNEWIRTYQRRTPGFPKLIREKEFSAIITENFGITVVNTLSRGAIYPGIKFIP
jgi:hypothetical protein